MRQRGKPCCHPGYKGLVSSGFKPFTLDVSGLHLQPKDRSLVGQTLRTRDQFTLSLAEVRLRHRTALRRDSGA